MFDNYDHELLEKYYSSVYKYCYYQIGYQERYASMIDDSVQDAFIKFAECYQSLDSSVNHLGWLRIAAWNRLRTMIRTEKDRAIKLRKVAIELAGPNPESIETDFDIWNNNESASYQIEKIYKTLTELEKKVFQHYFVEELDIDETAKSSKISRNAVRSAVERIRRRVRRKNF